MRVRWSTLRSVGNSFAARSTVLIPLVGYFIIFNSKLADYVSLIHEVTGTDTSGLSVSPRLFETYFGLCCIAVGAAIYSLFCPPTIKKYGSTGAFAGDDGSHYGKFAIEQLKDILSDSPQKAALDTVVGRYAPMGTMSGQDPPDSAYFQLNNAILHLYYTYPNRSAPILSALSATFFAIGFVVLLIPSIYVFARVSSVLFQLVHRQGLNVFFL
jgi:hypothetical protein